MRGKKQELDPVFARGKAIEHIQKLQEMLRTDLFNNKNTQPALEALSIILESDLSQLMKANVSDTEIQKKYDQYQEAPKEYLKEHISQLMMSKKLDEGIANKIINELDGKKSSEEKVKTEPHHNPTKLWADSRAKRPAENHDKEERTRKLTSAGNRNPQLVELHAKRTREAAAIEKQLKTETPVDTSADTKTFK